MRTEQELRKQLWNFEVHDQSHGNVQSELGGLPNPTVDQLEEVLEERILTDRRKNDVGNAGGTERRANQRRRST